MKFKRYSVFRHCHLPVFVYIVKTPGDLNSWNPHGTTVTILHASGKRLPPGTEGIVYPNEFVGAYDSVEEALTEYFIDFV